MPRLKVKNPERCMGCMSCVFACARIVHGVISTDRSAIKVRTTGGVIGSEFAIITCRLCEEPACVHACEYEALLMDKGRLNFEPEKCTACKACVEACLIGAITFDEELNKPIVCTHCGSCAEFCPHDVLEVEI